MKKKIWTPQEIYNFISEELEKNSSEKLICYIWKKETKETRTLYQNNFFWGLFSAIADYMWENKEFVRTIFLWTLFWTRKIRFNKEVIYTPIKPTTKDLDKKDAIYLIESLIKYIEDKNIPCKYSSRNMQSLLESLKLW